MWDVGRARQEDESRRARRQGRWGAEQLRVRGSRVTRATLWGWPPRHVSRWLSKWGPGSLRGSGRAFPPEAAAGGLISYCPQTLRVSVGTRRGPPRPSQQAPVCCRRGQGSPRPVPPPPSVPRKWAGRNRRVWGRWAGSPSTHTRLGSQGPSVALWSSALTVRPGLCPAVHVAPGRLPSCLDVFPGKDSGCGISPPRTNVQIK